MNMQPHHIFLGLAAVLAVILYTAAPSGNHNISSKPNVIIVALDGLQAKHLHEYGYNKQTTPHLDAFFDDSYVFMNAVSPASWTVPTYMSIFTSLYPSQHKLTNKLVEQKTATGTDLVDANVDTLKPGINRLSEVLKKHGYQTGAFTGDAGLSAKYGYGVGFDIYFETTAFGSIMDTKTKALEWLAGKEKDPFFILVHGYDAHGQHDVYGGLDYRYVTQPYTGPFTGTAVEQRLLRERGLQGQAINLTPESLQFWNAVYDEKINRADQWFGEFMRELEKRDLADGSIIIVLSDHGTELFEHRKFDHGHTLYSELLHVPLAIKVPGQHESARIHSLVSTLDVTPTILSILGIQDEVMDEQMEGIDLSRSFDGMNISRPIFSETDYRLYTHKRSITTPDGWKYILTRENNVAELYNLNDDPNELHNVTHTMTEKAKALNSELEKHFISIGDTGPWPLGCLAVYGDQCKQ